MKQKLVNIDTTSSSSIISSIFSSYIFKSLSHRYDSSRCRQLDWHIKLFSLLLVCMYFNSLIHITNAVIFFVFFLDIPLIISNLWIII